MSTCSICLKGLTIDERAKLRALGGAAWVRLQLREVELPRKARTAGMLTEEERLFAMTSSLPQAVIADRLSVKRDAVRDLRKYARRQAQTELAHASFGA